MKPIFIAFFVFTFSTCFSQDILQNSDFSQTNYGWQVDGSFHYSSNFSSCNSCPGYAYFSNPDGTAVDNATGDLFQTVTIPSNTTSATFSFAYSIHTSEPSTQANDLLDVGFYIGNTESWRVVTLSNQSATTYAGGPSNYQTISIAVPSNLIGQTVTVLFKASNNASNPTVFRIDDVQLNVVTGPTGPSTGYITWTDGSIPANNALVGAAEYLASLGLIDRAISDNQLNYSFTVATASVATVNALYRENIPVPLPSDYVPTFFGDIDGLPLDQYRAIKAMCFLEYGDGRPCISRDYTRIQPYSLITMGNILRMLFEAWNIPPNMNGFNILDNSPSAFLQNVNKNDYNYGYFQEAIAEGLLGNYASGGYLQGLNTSAGEFYYIVLANIVNRHYLAPIYDAAYYNSNNIQLSNANTSTDITRGVFKTYEQSGLSLPSSGLGLNFTYSYHSDWADLPLLGFDHYSVPIGNFVDWIAKERNFPLGIGWTHSYNITAQAVLDENQKDKYIIIHWGDGGIEVFNVATNQFESAGVKDVFFTTSIQNGHITSFYIRDKNQVVTNFALETATNPTLTNPSVYVASQITDANNNTLTFVYETATCYSETSCDGTTDLRLSSVIDNRAQRSLRFYYASGTDLLQSVTDGTRTIQFGVNLATLNLDNGTNARGYTTHYYYGGSDIDNHLLLTIQRPLGNTITNTYQNRKLAQVQTPDYVANITFTPSYASANVSTQSIVSIGPSSGAQYSITFNQNSTGVVSTISSASSNITYTYGDPGNLTLPTSIVDNNTGLRQQLTYDAMGNLKDSYLYGAQTTVTNHYTYTDRNKVQTRTWPNSTVTTYAYDQYGNETSEAASNYSMSYLVNPDGTVAGQTDAIGVQTGYGYNQYGNLNDIILFLDPFVHFKAEYDQLSRLKSITDGNGNQTQYSFNEDDQLTGTIQDPTGLNIQTIYGYDQNDNLRLITPPSNNSAVTFFPTSLTYNGTDDLINEQQGVLNRGWTYNLDGTIASYTQKDNSFFQYSYYPTNDPNQGKLRSNGFQTFIYDNSRRVLNQVFTTQANSSSIQYGYDDLLRPVNISLTAPSYQSEVDHKYDPSGNMTSLTMVNEGRSLSYYYDELNRLSYINDWNGNTIVRYGYLNNGLLSSATLSNGAVTHYHYDAVNRLDSIYCVKANSNSLLYSVGCTMDNNGNHIRESSFVQWNQSGPGGVPTPGQLVNASYNAYSRLSALNNQGLATDNLGNTITNPLSTFGNGVYDPVSHLLSCTVDGNNKTFLYDALGNRYGDDTLRYTVDALNNGNVLVQKKVGDNTPQRIYVYSPYGLVCGLDPQTAVPTFYLYDFRGSTLATLDATQSVVNYYKYDPWGNITESSIAPGKETPFLFVGQYGVMYESPHLYYMRARYYDPTIGRFIGEDSKWSTDLFSYAGNNPINKIDPSGNVLTSSFEGFDVNISGIYEFMSASGKLYVGQSSNIAARILQHIRSGRLSEEDINTIRIDEIQGGKLEREIAEQIEMDKSGGLEVLENIRNSIGPARQYLLEEFEDLEQMAPDLIDLL